MKDDPKTVNAVDKRLALSFGVLVLVLMLASTGVACVLFIRLNVNDESRLSSAVAMTLSEAIARVSFSGKYHARLLAEEMKTKVPALTEISIETADGRVIANSDPKLDGTVDEKSAKLREQAVSEGRTIFSESSSGAGEVREVVMPCKISFGSETSGVIRIGISMSEMRRERQASLLLLAGLIGALVAAAIWAVLFLSHRFGGEVRALAVQLQGLTDSAPGVMFQLGADGAGRVSTRFVSHSSESLFGTPSEPGLFLERFTACVAPECRDDFKSSLAKALREKRSWDFEGRFIRPDGEEMFFRAMLSLPRASGDESLCSGVLLDITSRKRIEMKLKASEERFSSICAMSPNMIGIARAADWKMLDCNPAFSVQTGYSRQEILDKPLPELSLFVRQDAWLKALDAFDERFGLLNFEFEMRTKNGGLKTCLLSLCSLSFDGDPCRLVVIYNITERKQIEEDLRRSRNMLANIMDSIPQSVFWKDLEGRFMGCNEVFAKTAHLASPSDIIGKTDWDFPWSKCADHYREDDMKVIREKCIKRHIIEQVSIPSGKTLWVDTSKAPLCDGEGNVYGVLGVFEDISERKRAEEENSRLQTQLSQARKMESVGRLAGGVAHDFNNMLQAIIGYVNLAVRKIEPGSKACSNLKEALSAAERSAALTKQLLAFASKQTAAPVKLDLNNAIGGMLKMLNRLIGEDIALEWLPGENLPRVKMDPSQLDQILANLVVNARDAMPSGGVARIMTSCVDVVPDSPSQAFSELPPGRYVALSVVDNGQGMSEEVKERIFEPFFTTKPVGHGTGLGLATVFGIVKQNGGAIHVESSPGAGASFEIALPGLPAEPEQALETRAQERIITIEGDETILLVEDEKRILDLGEEMLSACGYTVLKAERPELAIELALKRKGPIHLLLTDVVMPGMNGKELKQKIDAIVPGVRCLFMSGYTNDVIASHGVLEKGVEFLQKPFTMHVLAEKVRSVLDAKP